MTWALRRPPLGPSPSGKRPRDGTGSGRPALAPKVACAATPSSVGDCAATPRNVSPPIVIPLVLEQRLNTWGERLRQDMEKVAGRTATDLRIGTDCSGLEAPILSLQAMRISHSHVFSCERDAKKREYIYENFRPAHMFHDMCRRDPAAVPQHDLYVCGFPCKPFSTLHTRSSFFKEAEARPFFAMVRTLRACLPAVAVLENVIGIKRVLPKVWKSLRSLQWYEVLTVKIDPLDMGEPVARPRIFFLLIRVDVAKAHGRELDELATRLLNVGLLATKVNWSERLLPSSSPLVQHWLAKRAKRQPLAATQGIVGITPRQHKILATGLANSGVGSLREGVYIDVSQSVGRSRVRKHCPVVTPGSRIVLGEMRRLMIPIEKCLVHLVLVHRLSWPSSLTDNTVADLGGNTMHLPAAGALACRGALCSRSRVGRGP